MNLFIKQKHTHRLREWTYGYQPGRMGGRDKEFGINMHTLLYLKWKTSRRKNLKIKRDYDTDMHRGKTMWAPGGSWPSAKLGRGLRTNNPVNALDFRPSELCETFFLKTFFKWFKKKKELFYSGPNKLRASGYLCPMPPLASGFGAWLECLRRLFKTTYPLLIWIGFHIRPAVLQSRQIQL